MFQAASGVTKLVVVLVLLQATQDDRYSNRLVASVAQTMVEDAHGMVSIAGLDAIHFLLGTSFRNQRKPRVHFTALRSTAGHIPELSMYHRIDVGFVKRTDVLFDIADLLVILAVRFRLITANPHQCSVAS